jgi:hypothetical protein
MEGVPPFEASLDGKEDEDLVTSRTLRRPIQESPRRVEGLIHQNSAS